MTIRVATILDISPIIELLIEWLDESEVKFPGACAHTGVWMADLIANHVVILYMLNEKIVGVLGLKGSNFPWNNQEKIMINDCFLVKKEMRLFGIADDLMEFAKKFADEAKCRLIMGHSTGRDADLKDRFVQKHGFSYLGGNFIYEGA